MRFLLLTSLIAHAHANTVDDNLIYGQLSINELKAICPYGIKKLKSANTMNGLNYDIECKDK